MASAFAGGVAALAFSRYPGRSNDQVRQILRNTAQGNGCDSWLGHGIVDAFRAVTLDQAQIGPHLRIDGGASFVRQDGARVTAEVAVENAGALDIHRVLVVIFDGDPLHRRLIRRRLPIAHTFCSDGNSAIPSRPCLG